MRSALLLALLLASAGLYGCATRAEPVPATTATPVAKSGGIPETEIVEKMIPTGIQPCSNTAVNTNGCKIELNVTPVGTTGCVVTMASPDDDLITAGSLMRGKFIYWKIVTPNTPFVFTEDDGIDFLDNARPRGFAGGVRLEDEPTAFRWKNINRGRKVYGYVINVTNADGSISCFLDPWVRNK